MRLKGIVSSGNKASEIMELKDGTFTVYNFINHEERTTSISYPSKDYKTMRGSLNYAKKFLNA